MGGVEPNSRQVREDEGWEGGSRTQLPIPHISLNIIYAHSSEEKRNRTNAKTKEIGVPILFLSCDMFTIKLFRIFGLKI